ncbi:ParD-like family protein [Lelliottia amnigena]|jgi:Protein of unknown function (DUF3423).|uniref:ParD-like family protein n=1 Tax=Lelliottia amnigena TaxID=61646 RepID=A0AAP2F2K7_LELAM|nr:ParD-like family protein [Lelliottia amnigena]MBL5900111.1 ParD-like family protein [Lelliottia amnigena]MBL5935625.1 ParD-like family protein [Lelliottia amnigena]MBM7355041.1 hypothetical protein [Lelliottia amnigena]MCU7784758.1 ParD-like family protein [Lelliottia amnigena]NTX71219.1 hypothetical protein [Lelliottia amnigena]
MATSIRLDDDFVSDVKVYADAASRSIPKQIEHWAKIGRMAEDNPDLPYSFINEILIAQAEVDNNKVSRYERRTRRKSVTD